ncbi:hypothetical protein, partial [Bartonella sp. CL29QHWL]|uniref:hypothetical protein n=1 Tax=Bartonella sp. CL29QHWL TaxID=3243522 RepID=UPI0035D106A9
TNAQGSGLSLAQLTEGSAVRLQRVKGTEEVTSLIVTKMAFNDEGTATVMVVNTTERRGTFIDDTNNIATYPVTQNAV